MPLFASKHHHLGAFVRCTLLCVHNDDDDETSQRRRHPDTFKGERILAWENLLSIFLCCIADKESERNWWSAILISVGLAIKFYGPNRVYPNMWTLECVLRHFYIIIIYIHNKTNMNGMNRDEWLFYGTHIDLVKDPRNAFILECKMDTFVRENACIYVCIQISSKKEGWVHLIIWSIFLSSRYMNLLAASSWQILLEWIISKIKYIRRFCIFFSVQVKVDRY